MDRTIEGRVYPKIIGERRKKKEKKKEEREEKKEEKKKEGAKYEICNSCIYYKGACVMPYQVGPGWTKMLDQGFCNYWKQL